MSGPGSTEFVDYYKLLNIEPSAESLHIRAAYIRQAKQHHPDAGGTVEAMQLLNKAYRTLMSASSRAAYDMVHGFQTGKAASAYKYTEAASGSGADDMSDEEIDKFLDTMLAEFRHGVPKPPQSFKQRMKKYFTL